jgi:hypothetical protein
MNLDNAVAYDVETFPDVFTLTAEMLFSDVVSTWEISHYRDDRVQLFAWFNWLHETQTIMIGFFSQKFDYPLIHWLMNNPNATVEQIYDKSRALAKTFDGWTNIIYDRDRFAPQIDLHMVHHFDNKAKGTSLKALEINMRAPNVMDCPLPFGQPVGAANVPILIEYNRNDVKETKRFALYSLPALNFRIGLIGKLGNHPLEPLNYNDVKIGAKMFEERLGDDVCYDRVPRYEGDNYGKKQKRQTPRYRIALADIIFPYISFQHPEFQRILAFMQTQVLTPDDLEDPDAPIKTKGVFTGVTANVGGLTFVFGTGGMHASVERQRFAADDQWSIEDIDVAALYPSIAIVNSLAPEHLGDHFRRVYPTIKAERGLYAKGTYENGALKLANNGPWGQSNNKFSVFLDPQYAMTIPINGQLMICMLAERLATVPTLQMIQVNTDGITYRIHRSMIEQARTIEREWQAFTCLELEYAEYTRMWIRDVNNYVAEDTKGKLKQKGAYWAPAAGEGYADSISNASPPCWYKDFNPVIVQRAAVAAMVHGIDPAVFIRAHTDPFDFMLRVKADKSAQLLLAGQPIQGTTRYYVSTNGANMTIVRPPPAGRNIGDWKMAPKVTKAEYDRVLAETGGAWDARVCTKNQSKYDNTTTAIQAGWKVTACNDCRDFRFDNVNYDYYIAEARKLIIS